MKATYNITNDKLRVWFDGRLDADAYKTCKAAGFTFWHGSKCFAAKWSTRAEDFILSHGITIEEDDAPDDVESRVERFAGYADRAAESAERSQTYLDESANTERRKQNAVNAITRGLSEAEHWQERIEGAIRHAAYKEKPGVIARRIQGLEKDLRRMQKNLTTPFNPYNYLKKDDNGDYAREDGKLIVDRSAMLADLPNLKEKHAPEKARAERWIAHIENRLLYERAALNAAGGIPAEQGIEKGGAVKCWLGRGTWLLVTKVNKATVEVFDPTCNWRHYAKIEKTRITDTATAAQVEVGEVRVVMPEKDAA